MPESYGLAGPFVVKGSFVAKKLVGAIALATCALAVLGGFFWLTRTQFSQLMRDEQIWSNADAEAPASVSGDVTTREGLFDTYHLDVRYADASGALHGGKLEVETVFVGIDQKSEPYVKYRSQDPSQYSLSWAHDALTGRWMSIGFFCMAGLGLFGVFAVLAVTQTREVSAVREAAAVGSVAACDVFRIVEHYTNGRKTGLFTVHASVPEGVAGKPGVTTKGNYKPKKHELLRFNDGAKVLALVPPSAPQHAFLLRDDFYPLVLDEGAKAACRATLARLDAKAKEGASA